MSRSARNAGRFGVMAALLALTWGSYALLNEAPAATTNPEPLPAAVVPEAADLVSRPIDGIPVGTVLKAGKPPEKWSHLVLHAVPTLTDEDAKAAPAMAVKFARMFRYTVVADVAKTKDGTAFALQRFAHGFAVEATAGGEVIVNGKDTKGTDLGMFGRQILSENEKVLAEDVRQVVRTAGLLVYDAKCVMLRNTEHVPMLMRHAAIVNPESGELRMAVWLLTKDYEAADETFQLLPPNMEEKRLLSVKKDEFNFAGIPTRKAFGLRQVPQGKAIPLTASGKQLMATAKFTTTAAAELETALREIAK